MLCEILGISGTYYEKYEAEALKTYDGDFFSFSHMKKLANEFGLCDENVKSILHFIINVDENIKKFMWLFYFVQFNTDEDFSDNIWQIDKWMIPEQCEKKHPGMLKACVYLAAAENLRKWVADHSLSDDIFSGYFSRYKYFVELNRVSHNTYGLCRLSPFLYGYAKPFMLTIGRLSYQLIKYFNYCEVYENPEGNRFFAALPTHKYLSNGHIDENGKIPFYYKTTDTLTAHTFDSMGLLTGKPEVIKLGEYKKILSPGDSVATIHIPSGGKLDIDDVKQSICDAYKIINQCLKPIKAFVCRTWFIDPGLRDIIKEGSNMRSFADLFDVICNEDNENHSLFEHIFVTNRTDLSNLIPKNDFQRKMLARAMRGGKIYWSYGLLKKSVLGDCNK